MRFAGLQKTSLIDFPDRVATVLFTQGCNLRCPFCHNWRLVVDGREPLLSMERAIQILESRRRFVDAVVVTGGEPTMHVDVPQFLKRLTERGFTVKMDTNGFYPKVLERSLPYLRYVALDIKTSLEKYRLLGASTTRGLLRTIKMLKEGVVEYEFRCTAVPGLVEEDTIPSMGKVVKGGEFFVFQQFVPGDCLDKAYNQYKPHTNEEISLFARLMDEYVEKVDTRV